jgi:hypothetical protein
MRDPAGATLRPFLLAARIDQNGYSQALQRAILDFGAESPYAHVPARIREHYRIEIPSGSPARVVNKHLADLTDQQAMPAPRAGMAPEQLIAALDGCMIPIVSPAEGALDKRKGKVLSWMELKLCLVRAPGDVVPAFAGTIGSPEECGAQLSALARASAGGAPVRMHALGDGAPWIADQVEKAFGRLGNYLIDWFHACEYLSAAAPAFVKAGQPNWLAEMKGHLAEGRQSQVVACLMTKRERARKPGSKKPMPVRDCWRYMSRRIKQLDYKSAIDKSLPIGSGEIESAHRYVVQARLKKAGTWWKPKNAQAMVRLRALRINNRWEDYWAAKMPVSEVSL